MKRREEGCCLSNVATKISEKWKNNYARYFTITKRKYRKDKIKHFEVLEYSPVVPGNYWSDGVIDKQKLYRYRNFNFAYQWR